MEFTSGGGDFAIAPEGAVLGICVGITDIGMQETKFGRKDQVKLTFVLPDEKDDNDKPIFVSTGGLTKSLSDRSNITAYCKALLGKAPPADHSKFDITAFLNRPCQLEIEHSEYNGSTYANITGSSQVMKNLPIPQYDGATWFYDLKNPSESDLGLIPQYIVNKINFGDAKVTQQPTETTVATDDDIPW